MGEVYVSYLWVLFHVVYFLIGGVTGAIVAGFFLESRTWMPVTFIVSVFLWLPVLVVWVAWCLVDDLIVQRFR